MLPLDLSCLRRRAALVASALTLVSTAACSDAATTPLSPAVPTSASSAIGSTGASAIYDTPPVIDGVMGPGEWDGAEASKFPVWVPGDILFPSSSATVYVGRDPSYMYLALVLDRNSPFHSNDHVSFEFDIDHDGNAETGDDIVGIYALSQSPFDNYRFKVGMLVASDEAGGGANNAIGRFKATGSKGVVEIRKEINSTDDAHDFSIDNDGGGYITMGMRAMVALERNPHDSGLYVRSWEPGYSTYCTLIVARRRVEISCP